MLLYIHKDHKGCYGWGARMATLTVTQLLSSEIQTLSVLICALVRLLMRLGDPVTDL